MQVNDSRVPLKIVCKFHREIVQAFEILILRLELKAKVF